MTWGSTSSRGISALEKPRFCWPEMKYVYVLFPEFKKEKTGYTYLQKEPISNKIIMSLQISLAEPECVL